jgi:hypothetical protein
LRASPLYPKIPAQLRSFVDGTPGADEILLAYRRTELMAAMRGAFAQTPPGSTQIAPGLMVSGTPNLVRQASERFRSGKAAPELTAQAESIAPSSPAWIVARGTAEIPLSGNAANLNNLLRLTDYTVVSLKSANTFALEIVAVCRTDADAGNLEEKLRAIVSLARIAHRQPGFLSSIILHRDGNRVQVNGVADPNELLPLFR